MTPYQHCQYPGCRGFATILRLPLSQRFVWVCQRHRNLASLRRLKELVA